MYRGFGSRGGFALGTHFVCSLARAGIGGIVGPAAPPVRAGRRVVGGRWARGFVVVASPSAPRPKMSSAACTFPWRAARN